MDSLQVDISAPVDLTDDVLVAPLSFAQQRLWFLNQLEPDSAAYNISTMVRIDGKLDVDVLERSMNEVVRRHEILRTSFVMRAERVVQVVAPHYSFKFERFDLCDIEDAQQQLQQLAREAVQRPFDLAELPLMTARLLRLSAEEHVMVLVMDHIIGDGWSLGLLINELSQLYRAYSAGEPSPLPELESQYVDYAEWQREWLSGKRLETQLDYWKRKLTDLPRLELPFDRTAAPKDADRGAREIIRLPKLLSLELKDLSRRQRVTLFMSLLAAFQALLCRYTGQTDFAVGTPIAGRTRPETYKLIGFFVNTLVLRADLSGNPSFLELLQRVRQTTLEAYTHQDLPFELLVEELNPERSMTHAPLFQAMIGLHQWPRPDESPGGVTIKPLKVESERAIFDLLFTFGDREHGLDIAVDYRTERFDRSTIRRMGVHFQQLLEGIVADPARPIFSLPLITANERRQLLKDWNETSTAYPQAVVQELFEEQTARNPEAVAVVFGEEEISYDELNRRANQLAHYLRQLGVGPEVVVGLCVERSIEMVVGVLGILKAGGAYLPLDPQNPLERLSFMLEDASVPVLLIQEHLLGSLPSHWSQVISLDADWDLIAQFSESNPLVETSPENLAYVMYTSGSTGIPKGVSVVHSNIVRLVKDTDYARFGADEVFLQMAPLSFDASTFELWGSLLNGAKLVVLPPQQPTLAELGAALARHEVTTLWLTAGLFHLMVDEGVEHLRGVRQLLAGGDTLNVKRVKQVLAGMSTEQRLINGYGPTEGTTFSCCYVMDRHTEIGATVPIGRPIANTEVYVLDRSQQPVPVGVAGELYLGGDGLARGYLNRPDLTAEKFVPHPFSATTGARLYRTGDRVRYLANGDLEFLGRLDQQIKLRGFRIEPGEIETALAEHHAVQEVVVIVQSDEIEKRLVAYVVLQPEQPPAVSELRAYLQRRVPEYMMPAGIVVLEALPLTANGKVDRRALPALTTAALETEYVRPRTPIEEMLAALWSEVLNVERVSATDDFFELGGHSLLATQLLSRVRDAFQVDVPLRYIFEQPRLGEFAAVLQAQLSGTNGTGPATAIVPVSREQVLPLSFAQQRLWFLDQLIPGTPLYNISIGVKLSGQLNIEALEKTLSEIIRRHEILRTTFTLVDGTPVQVVHPHGPLQLTTIELDRQEQLRAIVDEETRRPFDLSNGPLLRTLLVKVSDEEHIAVITIHHIITDGWSMGILVREVKALYEAFVAGKPSPLPELAIQYADFAAWEQSQGSERLEKALSYWHRELADAPVLELPTDRPRASLSKQRGATERFRLSESLTKALNELSRREGATLFMTLLAAWHLLLSRYSGQEDICVGTPIANRNRMDTESLIGFFVNTLVLRLDLAGNPRFNELLARERTTCLNGYAHQDVPFEKLVEQITLERDLRHSPLFQVMLVLQNAPFEFLELPGLKLSLLETPVHSAKFDLMLAFHETENCLAGSLEYDTDLFDRSTVQRMVQHLQTLLESIVSNPNARLSELPFLTEGERKLLLKDWNQTATAYPRDRCVQELFEEQVERNPEAVAVVFRDEEVSYGELNRRANKLAHRLRELGVGPEVAVALCIERSVELVVGVLGILKAGGAYLPLDLQNPIERLRFMLEDADVPVLLTQQHLRASVPDCAHVIALDADWESIAQRSDRNPAVSMSPENLAYVMYTSGSTGIPKGVSIVHRSIARLVKETNYAEFSADEVFLLLAPMSFDLSTFELWGCLLNGARLAVLPPQQPTLAELNDAFARYGVTTLWLTAGLFHLAVDEGVNFNGVRQLLAGGDALSVKHVKQVLAGLPEGHKLIDGYGPTEVTTFGCCNVMDRHTQIDGTVPIGRPISNTDSYVLDPWLQPLPIGVAGELCLGGDGVARGYLNRPALTAERFVPHPFTDEPGARLYRTGDRVRYLPNGELEFLGRFDHQVKLRGIRIELEEIETTLKEHSGVLEAVVLAQVEGVEKRLVAYVVLQPEQPPAISELRSYLQRQLPDYMVPAGIMAIPEIPLTANGKVNRRALPAITLEGIEAEFVAPRTPIEEMLAALWSEVLGVERVSVTDDFFELGGHSLLATRLLSRVRDVFQVDVPLRHIFEQSRLIDFATILDQQLSGGNLATAYAIVPVSREQVLPLSFAQQRLWFIEQLEPTAAAYHISEVLRMKGRLNLDALRSAFDEMVRRHEILRTVFVADNGEPAQLVELPFAVGLPVIDLSASTPSDRDAATKQLIKENAEAPFDLEHGPLFRLKLVKLDDQDHVLIVTMHHIITDGWSLGVLVRELSTLYQAFVTNNPSSLPELPIQYGDFSYWQRHSSDYGVDEKELDYWRQQLAGPLPVLALPADHQRPAQLSYRGAAIDFAFSQDLTRKLNRLSRAHRSTLFMTLLAAFQTLLHRHTGQDDIIVGSPIANRQRIELENLIGFFVNTLAIRVDFSGDPTFTELLARVRETALGAYAHQRTPFEKLVQELQPDRDLSHSPIFQVLFALQNAPSARLDLPELSFVPHELPITATRFELECLMWEQESQLRGILIYSQDLFAEMTIRAMLTNFEVLLEGLTDNPGERITALPLLSEAKERQLLVEWNDTAATFSRDLCIHERVAQQADKTPDEIALVFGAHRFSYRELSQRANQLAHYLRRLGVDRESRVGIMMDRSADMLISVLATLKAGASYLPLDPEYPRERVLFMLQDAGVQVLLTEPRLLERLPDTAARVICLEDHANAISLESTQNPTSYSHSENLAYVIYTSGSTGTPKAVAMPHRALGNLIEWQVLHSAKAPRTLQFASLSFDVSFQEMFSTWCTGGTLVVIDEDTRRDSRQLLNTLIQEDIERLFVPYVALHYLAQAAESENIVPARLRQVITAGEQLKVTPAIRSFLGKLERVTLENHYGPSETHLATALTLDGPPDEWPELPAIGRPIANAQTYVLDSRMQPVPLGVVGELYIGGDGLARGYLHCPDVTASRFVPDPFASQAGARLYRTGDLARYQTDGNLQFLGRQDQQVKIRGYRIELGEVETLLRRHPLVREALVVAQEARAGEKALVAYILAEPDSGLAAADLRRHLTQHAPEYMTPAAFVFLSEFPLTPSGKLNRRALPKPDLSAAARAVYVAPRTPTEELLATLWADVLGVDRIGVHDNFFELGGHSLIATRLMSLVREAFRVDLPLRSLFITPTVAGLATTIDDERNAANALVAPPLLAVSREEELPLSFAQERMWFLNQLDPDSPAYNMSTAVNLRGSLNRTALEAGFNELIRRHESLRTTFSNTNGQVVQVIAPAATVALELIDLSDLRADERDAEAERLIRAEACTPFNLAEGPLFRARLLRKSPEAHLLLVTMHHIVSDGWSMNILVGELTTFYSAFVNGVRPALPELPIQYADFAVWQKQWLTGEVLDRQVAYWKKQLQQPPLLELPTDRHRPPVQTYNGAQHVVALPAETSKRLKELSKQNGVTLFMTLLAAFKILLSRYTGQEDVIVGTPIAGRNRTEVEGLIGFLVNTLVLRTDLSGDPTFNELLRRVREVTLDAYQYQDLPFERLVDVLQVRRDPSNTPLFQVMFALQNLLPAEIDVPDLEIAPVSLSEETAKFDLTLVASERGEQTIGTIVYNTDLFDAPTIERLADHFVIVADAVAANPSLRLSGLNLITDAERRCMLEWSCNRVEYPRDKSIFELFEQQVQLTPDAIALIAADEQLTYRELNNSANELAHRLRRVGVGPEVLVGLCMNRSPAMIVGMLGILKAGGAYLPLDPAYPKDRLAFMLEDGNVPVVVTQQSLIDKLPQLSAAVLCLDDDAKQTAEVDLPVEVDAANLAYVIYTSGSTGRPKGVAIQHQSAVTLMHWARSVFTSEELAGVLASTSICFDLSVFEIFVPLSCGGTVILAENALHLPALQAAAKVTLINTVPSAMAELLKMKSVPASVQTVNLAGEPLRSALSQQILSETNAQKLYNLYGPSEDTTYSTFAQMDREPDYRPTIGRPVANTEAYILDDHLNPLPIGVVGELYLSGEGLARGYLNRPEVTATQFIPNPFSVTPGTRIYRTGDLARYLPDGNIDFLGRRDSQVKVRGFRIELGEVEFACAQHPAVKEAVVIAESEASGNKRLIAYLTTETTVTGGALRSFLKERLPDYMAPSVFVFLEEFPLTLNGKINRRGLPAPPESERDLQEDLTPRTPVEDVLRNIWADVLNRPSPGLHDDFFEIGGHSLLATQVITRIQGALQVELPLRELFINPTIAGLARVVDDALKAGQGVGGSRIVKVSRDQDLPLSFAQQRLWFLDQLEPNNPAYHLPVVVRLKGPLDVAALKLSLSEVVRRHEVLRTVFKLTERGPVQCPSPPGELPVPILDLSQLDSEKREQEVNQLCLAEIKRPFDLTQGPLVRAGLIKVDDDEYVLQLVMHHIVGDAGSLEILVREAMQLYQAFRMDQPSPLPELPVQYADYASWQHDWMQGEAFAKLLAYWKPQLEGAPPLLELPADRPRPPAQSSRGDRYTFTIGAELTTALKKLSRREDATIFMTLLAAFQTLLSRYTGVEDIVIGADVNNRTQLETEGLIGFFINMLVLRTDLSGNPTFKELLARVRQVALGAYAHQEMPLEKLVEELQPERNLSYSPLFQVVFNFNNSLTQAPEVSDLKVTQSQLEFTQVKFDLSLFMWDGPEHLTGMWTYSTDLFEADRIHRMHEHFVTLLQRIVEQPEQRLNALEYQTASEKEAQATAKHKLKQAAFQKFKSLRPQAVKHSRTNLVQAEMLHPGESLPLVIRPDVEAVDLAAWAKDNLQFIDTQLSKYGALLFRDFEVNSLSDFTEFTGAVSPELLDYSEPSSPRTHLQDRIYTSTEYPADQWIQLHNEMSYAHAWPRRVYFFCDQPARQGGETPIAFSRKVFELLDPKLRERFMQRKVMYVRNFGDGLDLPWQHVFHTDDKEAVAAYCRAANVEFAWNNGSLQTRQVRQAVIKHPETGETVWFNQAHAFHASTLDAQVREFLLSEKTEDEFPRNAYYGDGTPIENSVITEIREAYRQAAVLFPWKHSDILMLDNMRVAHGRAPFVGPRKILVAMSGRVSSHDVDTSGDRN